MAAGRLILPIAEPLLDASGLVVTGATLTVYSTGTTDLAILYEDAGETTPIANPQVSNSAGRFYDQATVWWADSAGAYDCLVSLPDGSSLTYDQIYVLGAQANTSGFAPLNSPFFTGIPQAPNPASNDDSDKLATTHFVQSQGYAPLNSPALTNTPTAPTAAPLTGNTQLATTAYADAAAVAAANEAVAALSSSRVYATQSAGLATIVKTTGVASIVQVSTGHWEFTLTVPMANTYYIVKGNVGENTNGNSGWSFDEGFTTTTTKFRIFTYNGGGSHDPASFRFEVSANN